MLYMRGRVWLNFGDPHLETAQTSRVSLRGSRRTEGGRWCGLHEDGNTKVKRCGRTVGMRKEAKRTGQEK